MRKTTKRHPRPAVCINDRVKCRGRCGTVLKVFETGAEVRFDGEELTRGLPVEPLHVLTPRFTKRFVKGEIVEVRWHHHYRNRGGREVTSWHRETVLEDRGHHIDIEGREGVDYVLQGWPTTFARCDVRRPRKRKDSGKVRGRGGPGGWVPA